jgi:hypothetical protein
MNATGAQCSRAAPLVITGMHRSGTSLAAALLHSSGVAIGERLLPTGPEHGYAEDLDVVELHQDMLRDRGASSAGYTLEDELAVDPERAALARELVSTKNVRDPWGFKDPRAALFLGFWSRLLPRARFVLIYRAPWDVIDSLYRRGDFAFFWTPGLAVQLWLHYNRSIVALARRAPERCLIAGIDAISRRPGAWITALAERFALELGAPDPGLLHAHLLRDTPPRRCHLAAIRDACPEALELYAELRALDAMSQGTHRERDLCDTGCPGTEQGEDPLAVFAAWMEERRVEAVAAGRTGWSSEGPDR